MAQYELNLRDYIRIFRKQRLLITFTLFFVTAASLIFTLGKTAVYEAVTTVKVEERKTIAGLLTEWIVFSPGDTMESQAKLIHGFDIMKKTALRLGMISDKSSKPEIDEKVSQLSGKIETEKIGTTNIIRIIAHSTDSQEAITIANTVADVYIEENLLEKTRQARTARQFIEEQIASLEKRLQQKEEALRKLSQKSRDIVLSEPIQQKLAELQFNLTEMLQKYTEKHPKVIQLREQIKELEKKSAGVSNEDLNYSRLKREVDADRKLFSMLKEKLEEARITEAEKVGDVSIVNPAVTAAISSAPNIMMALVVGLILGIVLGFALALIVESLDTSIATIEDVEKIVKVPVLGIIPSVSWSVEAKTQKDMLFNIKKQFLNQPKTEAEEKYIRLISHYNPTSPIAEAYRNIHTNLKLSEGKKAVLITSAGPREGKSSILMNLGIAIAQSGMKILLVASDVRRPVISRTLGIKREPGLTEVLLGMVDLKDAMRNITDFMLGDMNFEEIMATPGLDNVWVLPSGQLPFNPAKILESKELSEMIEKVKKEFDLVIFDSPPVLPVTDASLLATKMDCVIMVYEIGRTSRDALLRAKNQLDSVGAKTIGIILNQTRHELDADVIYPYHYKYRYYESEKPKEETKKQPIAT